jgi:FkbM family methyltransferase
LSEEEKLYTNLDLHNKVVMDVGAHIGVYTLLFAKLFRSVRVVSFEPNPDCFSLLCKNIHANGLTNVTAFQVGVSNEEATICFASNKYNTAKGTFRSDRRSDWKMQGKITHERKISVKSIDKVVEELGLDCLDFVKIDTEGFEPCVIEGMPDSLKRFHPLLYFV